ncbi:MAG: RHS repeat-associated core domain-containing protein [Clostridia bacterium]|nr:RHS repeat-associated core domain-containing protein [Clostridia bacterium]
MLATKRDLVAKKNYQYYLITNTRGDIIETRDDYGNVSAKFVYDAWGKLVAVTDANGNALSTDSFAYQISLKYRGYVYDNETGLYYLQSRYYDPETGRFLNADDVGFIGYSGEQLSYNVFAYCGNEPVCNCDISGKIKVKITYRRNYIDVYKYKFSITGHIDFSINGKIYSFGSNSAPYKQKLQGTAAGYLRTSSVLYWHTDEEMICTGKTRVWMTDDEFITLITSLTVFMSTCVSKVNESKDANIKMFRVIRGRYSYYSFTKANCATFVRDIVISSIPDLAKKYKSVYSMLIIPANVYKVISSWGTKI